MEASLELEVGSPDLVKRALEVEDDVSSPIDVLIKSDENLSINIKADRLSNLRAGINTIFRLVKASKSSMRR